jgi:hypothetical protein
MNAQRAGEKKLGHILGVLIEVLPAQASVLVEEAWEPDAIFCWSFFQEPLIDATGRCVLPQSHVSDIRCLHGRDSLEEPTKVLGNGSVSEDGHSFEGVQGLSKRIDV